MINPDSNRHLIGYFFAIFAALMWGISGTVAQYLFQQKGFTAEGLVTIRLLVAGSILIVVSARKGSGRVFAPWRKGVDRFRLLAFAFLGMLAVQYTYFAAIRNSNAATATVLQYLGPVLIVCYFAMQSKRPPILRESVAIALALTGTILIVTHGKLETLSISPLALFWGLSSAVALATYSILPQKLMERFDTAAIVGWGMLIGGLGLIALIPRTSLTATWDTATVVAVAAIILFGTALAFLSYVTAVKLVGPTKASLLACAEPLSAALIAVVWLGTKFTVIDWIGSFSIIAAVGVLAVGEKSEPKKESP